MPDRENVKYEGGRSATFALVLLALVVAFGIFFAFRAPSKSGPNAAGPADAVPDLSGVWVGKPVQSYNPSDPKGLNLEDGTPYQPWALAKLKSERPGTGPNGTFDSTDPALKYNDPDGYPRVLLHPFRYKFVVTRDFVYQLFQFQQNWRAIAMNRQHPADPDPTWFGDAIGRFEGDTLVVDTVGFNDRAWLDPVGRPHTDALHLVERIRRADHDTLVDEITFEDPKTYTKPWKGQVTFKLDPSGNMDEGFSTLSDELRFQNDIIKPSKGKPPQK
jgi:hypothetical protein